MKGAKLTGLPEYEFINCKVIKSSADHAEELAKALKPFANYACDDETDPNHCHNCAARAVLTNYREATK